MARLTEKVRAGLWLIVKRSATVMSAEAGPEGWDKQERAAVLAAAKYAEQKWGRELLASDEQEDE